MSALKRRHVMAGHRWDAQVDLACRDASRALKRGLGPGRQAAEVPMTKLLAPDAAVLTGRTPQWPAAGVAVMVANGSWLLREIESGTAFLKAVTFEDALVGCGSASWDLPCSKADPAALGKLRTRYIVLARRTLQRVPPTAPCGP